MTYEELLSDIDSKNYRESRTLETPYAALRAVVELHKEKLDDVGRPVCSECMMGSSWRIYPCPTIKAIEEELA